MYKGRPLASTRIVSEWPWTFAVAARTVAGLPDVAGGEAAADAGVDPPATAATVMPPTAATAATPTAATAVRERFRAPLSYGAGDGPKMWTVEKRYDRGLHRLIRPRTSWRARPGRTSADRAARRCRDRPTPGRRRRRRQPRGDRGRRRHRPGVADARLVVGSAMHGSCHGEIGAGVHPAGAQGYRPARAARPQERHMVRPTTPGGWCESVAGARWWVWSRSDRAQVAAASRVQRTPHGRRRPSSSFMAELEVGHNPCPGAASGRVSWRAPRVRSRRMRR
jgi:hypothetical protein